MRSAPKKCQKRSRKTPPPAPKLTIMWDAEIDYAQRLIAELEPFAQARRVETLIERKAPVNT